MKTWSKEDIKNLLVTNDKAVSRAVIAIYNHQTTDEQQSENTRYHNGIGFNGADAKILSGFATQIIQRGFLSPKQLEIARKKIMKYAGQLTQIANVKQG